MAEPPDAHPPLVRSNEAPRDISAVVESIRRSRPCAGVALFGWATGGQTMGGLIPSPKVPGGVIPGATHFVHLDREARGRKILLEEVASFLRKN